MTSIPIKGIRTQTVKGKVYRYHRRTKIRIEIDPEAFPLEFLARVRELDDMADGIPKPVAQKRRSDTLGDMFDAWVASEEWAALKPQSRYSYERVIAPKAGFVAKVRGRRVAEFDTPFIISIRDTIKRKHKLWAANYTVKVLRVAFGWGRLRGWCKTNPAKGVPLLTKPVDAPKRNRMWTAEEFEIVWHHASDALRRAIALAYYAGMRVGDIVAIEWSSWDGEALSWHQSKTGHLVHVRAAIPLRDELNAGEGQGTRILVNREGQAYTRDGLQTLLWNLVKRLEYLGLVKPGLCFHGLRHSLGAALYDLGLDREARKAALGHVSDAASAVYERDGNRRAASDRAFVALNDHLSAHRDIPRTNDKRNAVQRVANHVANSSR